MKKWIFWDFDGTLAFREGHFSGALVKVYRENHPGTGLSLDTIKAGLRSKFPWHEPEKNYDFLCGHDKWWDYVEGIFAKAYVMCGVCENEAVRLSKLAHYEYVDPAGFNLFPDTVETLIYFIDNGWSNAVLSNHTPDLPDIVKGLGLDKYIQHSISSANIGYEKPNSMFFRKAFSLIGKIDAAWMIGDSYIADVKGAEGVGIKAVHVRSNPVEGDHLYSPDLHGLKRIIGDTKVCELYS